jgi:hypothetical protein
MESDFAISTHRITRARAAAQAQKQTTWDFL